MKDKIEVGEYVRTDKGTIGKIEDVGWDLLYRITTMKPIYKHWISKNQCYTEEVIKHSKNIIDLIEVGDYVNGELIEESDYDLFINSDIKEEYAKTIETIVTKEQFKEMEYRV